MRKLPVFDPFAAHRLQNQQLIDMLLKQKLEEAAAAKPAHQPPAQPAQPPQTTHVLPQNPPLQAPVVPAQCPTVPVIPAQALHNTHEPAPSQQMEVGEPLHSSTQPHQQEVLMMSQPHVILILI